MKIAKKILKSTNKKTSKIVRSYREKPSPLVKDSVREWRTGRLDLVLRGDFDLLE